jgi:hypothetical protein
MYVTERENEATIVSSTIFYLHLGNNILACPPDNNSQIRLSFKSFDPSPEFHLLYNHGGFKRSACLVVDQTTQAADLQQLTTLMPAGRDRNNGR